MPLDASKPWSLLLWARPEKAGWHTLCGVADANGALQSGEVEIGITGQRAGKRVRPFRDEAGLTVSGLGAASHSGALQADLGASCPEVTMQKQKHTAVP